MKRQDRTGHLTQDQIIKGVVDVNDLDKSSLNHLEECRDCREKIGFFAEELNAISKKTATLSFPPDPDIEAILNYKPRKTNFRFRFSKPIAGFCLFAGIVVMALFFQEFLVPKHDLAPKISYSSEFLTGLEFMFDINAFEDFGLSEFAYEKEDKKAVFEQFINRMIYYDDEITGHNIAQYPL